MRLEHVATSLALFLGSTLAATAAEPNIDCAIELTQGSGGLTRISAEVHAANQGARATYLLAATKTGAAGTATSRQSGHIELEPEKDYRLAKSTISIGPKDQLEITFTLTGLDGNELCSATSIGGMI